jgi:hypothetical protein
METQQITTQILKDMDDDNDDDGAYLTTACYTMDWKKGVIKI